MNDRTLAAAQSTTQTAQPVYAYAHEQTAAPLASDFPESFDESTRVDGTDEVPPTTNASLSGAIGDNGWYVSEVTVTFTASGGTGGLDRIFYHVDAGSWATYAIPFPIGEGRHVLEYYATSRAGDREPTRTRSVNVDRTPPLTSAAPSGTLGENEWYTSQVIVTLSVADALSGVSSIAYHLGGRDWLPYREPFLISEAGRHVVEFASVDVAGNHESIHRFTVSVETSMPYFLFLSGSPDSAASSVQVSWSAADNDSGIAEYAVRWDDRPFMSVGSETTITLNLDDGSHVIEVKAIDHAGQAIVRSLTIQIVSAAGAAASLSSGLMALSPIIFLGGAMPIAFTVSWMFRRRKEEIS